MVPVAAIYTRGLNPPYTEGHISAVRSMMRAISLGGWAVLALNFRYFTRSGTDLPPGKPGAVFDMRVPCIERDTILHESRTSPHSKLASILESLLTPCMFVKELRVKTSLVHLVNCFTLPRVLLRLFRKTPVIVHIYQPQGVDGSITRSLPLPIDAMVASSRRVADSLETLQCGRVPIFTVPPAVDTDFFYPKHKVESLPRTGLYLGNLSRTRFPDDLLGVFQQVIRTDPSVSFRIVASPHGANLTRANEIRAICRSLHIESKVALSLRDMNDADKLAEYRSARFFIFAPSRESCTAVEPPLTVLEAISSGCPVLSTGTNSVAEVVTSGRNGFLVGEEDYVDLVDRAVHLLQADDDRWMAWSKEARRVAVDSYSIMSASKSLARVHSAVLKS